MADYQPLDLSPFYNAGLSLYPKGPEPPLGEQQLHGLPFRIGEGDNCFVSLGATPVVVPVGRAVRRVLFAHALLESRIPEGEPVGFVVATYTFRYADGESIVV